MLFIVIFIQASHIVIIDIAFLANFGSKFFMGFINSSIFIFCFDHNCFIPIRQFWMVVLHGTEP